MALAGFGALSMGFPAPASAAPMPAGYTVAFSTQVTAADGTHTRAVAHCPKGTVPFGGGAFAFAPGLTAGLASSFPTANGWAVEMNNASGDTIFYDSAVTCGRKPAHYSVVTSRPVPNPVGRRTTAVVSCPKVAKPLGGGGQSASKGLFANLGATGPVKSGWRVEESNATASAPTVKVFVICGSVAGYRQVTGPAVNLPANTQSHVAASCPLRGAQLSGGVAEMTNSVGGNVNSTGPVNTPVMTQPTDGTVFFPQWSALVNNATGVDVTATPFAVCAGG